MLHRNNNQFWKTLKNANSKISNDSAGNILEDFILQLICSGDDTVDDSCFQLYFGGEVGIGVDREARFFFRQLQRCIELVIINKTRVYFLNTILFISDLNI